MSVWRERRQRAVALMGRQAHAEEILGFYVATLEAQEQVWQWMRSQPSAVLEAPSPVAIVEAIDPAALQERFRDFCARLAAVAPDPLVQSARAMMEKPADGLPRAFAVAVDAAGGTREARDGTLPRGLPDGAGIERCSMPPEALSFFGSAFLEPVAVEGRAYRGAGENAGLPSPETSGVASGGRNTGAATCAYCGRAPLVAVLVDQGEAQGRRLAACGFCAQQWTVRRATCLACGESDTSRLTHHVGDSLPHVRVEECTSCGVYHKTVDLRVDGRAVPVVDELASVELDLWARERGLEKLRPNLLGL